jgi:hypothetical protein
MVLSLLVAHQFVHFLRNGGIIPVTISDLIATHPDGVEME